MKIQGRIHNFSTLKLQGIAENGEATVNRDYGVSDTTEIDEDEAEAFEENAPFGSASAAGTGKDYTELEVVPSPVVQSEFALREPSSGVVALLNDNSSMARFIDKNSGGTDAEEPTDGAPSETTYADTESAEDEGEEIADELFTSEDTADDDPVFPEGTPDTLEGVATATLIQVMKDESEDSAIRAQIAADVLGL